MFFKTLYVGIWEILEINQHYVSEKKERSKFWLNCFQMVFIWLTKK